MSTVWDKLLGSKWSLVFAVLLGVALMAPAINIGLVADDYIQWALLSGHASNPQPGSFWGLFTFFDGNPVHNQALKDSGRLVWFASNELKLSFWRPLSELSQWVDFQLWPHSPVMMHVHDLLWYGLLVYLLGRYYRTLDSDRRQTNLATLLFATSLPHVFAVAWLAARNQLISGVLILLSLMAFHAWRTGRGRRHAWLAAAWLVLGLLSAEAAIDTVGYMVAYALVLDKEAHFWRRWRALLPFVLIVLVWKGVHSHLGYGSTASPAYIDPANQLPRFLHSMVLRLPALMASQWLGASTGVFEQLPHAQQVLYALAAVALLGGLALAIRRVGGFASPLARYHAIGSVLVLVPACATLSMDRLVLGANIGMSALLAIALCQFWDRRKALVGWAAGTAKYAMHGLAAIHVVLFPLATLGSSALLKSMLTPTTVDEPLSLPDASKIAAPHVLLVNPPVAEMVYYYPVARQYFGVANPVSMQALASGTEAMTLTRLDDAMLELQVPGGIRSKMARDEITQPSRMGEFNRMGDIRIVVMEVTPDKLPKTVLFVFPSSIDNPEWQFYAWQDTGYAPFKVPAVGRSVKLAAVDLTKMVTGRLKSK